jgi:CysZ protein
MFRAFSLTLSQLGDPAILKVLAKSLALTVALCLAFGFLAAGATYYGINFYVTHFEDDGLSILIGGLVSLLMLIFLFRAVAIPVISFFADEIVAAIERRHYPDAAASARHVGIGRSMVMAGGSLARLVGLNLLALPGYIALAVTGIGPFLLFFAVNALLLGRDLGEMVAARHLDRPALKDWLRTSRAERTMIGLIASALFVFPFLNLLAPVMGAGMATHLYHGRKR